MFVYLSLTTIPGVVNYRSSGGNGTCSIYSDRNYLFVCINAHTNTMDSSLPKHREKTLLAMKFAHCWADELLSPSVLRSQADYVMRGVNECILL